MNEKDDLLTNPSESLKDTNLKLLLAAIEERLKMSCEERIEAHENARELLNDLQKAEKSASAKSESPA